LKNLSPLAGLGFAQTETTAFSRGYILTPLRGSVQFKCSFKILQNMIRTTEHIVQSKGHCDIHDLTPALGRELATSGLRDGQVLVFVPGSTAGITTVEFEPGLVRDLNDFFEGLIPEQRDYFHHATWGDDNGSSHLRAALLKPSLTIPFKNGQLLTGTWQQVVSRSVMDTRHKVTAKWIKPQSRHRFADGFSSPFEKA